jgi:hypothetical protein
MYKEIQTLVAELESHNDSIEIDKKVEEIRIKKAFL